MQQVSIQQVTAERLERYRLFSETTIKVVSAFAKKQAEYKKYQDFFNDVGVPSVALHVTGKGNGVPYVDIQSERRVDEIIIMHLPMGNALDENQLYQVATIAAINPTSRVIAFGNPSGPPHKYRQQNLTFLRRFNIAFTRNTRDLVDAELDYLRSQGVKNAYHVGYSYGALKAIIECYYSEEGSIKGIIVVDPVAHSRGLKQLIEDFQSTFEPLGEYVNRTRIPSFFDARKAADTKAGRATQTLLRQINIAIGILLARSDFLALLEKVIAKNPHMKTVVAWASKSELGNDAHLKAYLHNRAHNNSNVRAMRLEGDKHAVANDIYLYGAIVKEALEG